METNWKIINVKSIPSNGLVIEVTYVMNFKLENKDDRHIGMITLEGDPDDPNFIPYEQLTEEIVLNWVQSELVESEIQRIQTEMLNRLQERINIEQNPPFIQGLPWRNND